MAVSVQPRVLSLAAKYHVI